MLVEISQHQMPVVAVGLTVLLVSRIYLYRQLGFGAGSPPALLLTALGFICLVGCGRVILACFALASESMFASKLVAGSATLAFLIGCLLVEHMRKEKPLPYNPWRQQLIRFYSRHNPSRLPHVEFILKKYGRREEMLLSRLHKKYCAKEDNHEVHLLECPICLEIMECPVTLTCQHTFCRDCIIGHSAIQRNCPQCRAEIGQVMSDTPVNTLVSALCSSVSTKRA
jgi:hypothetical protein